jgi:hypothetical protein
LFTAQISIQLPAANKKATGFESPVTCANAICAGKQNGHGWSAPVAEFVKTNRSAIDQQAHHDKRICKDFIHHVCASFLCDDGDRVS